MSEQQTLIGIRFCVAAPEQLPAVGGRQMDTDHLQAGEVLQHRAVVRALRLVQRLPLAKLRMPALGQVAQVLPDLPSDYGTARPAPGASRANDDQRDHGRSGNFSVAAQPSDTLDREVGPGEKGLQARGVIAKLGAQARAGDL